MEPSIIRIALVMSTNAIIETREASLSIMINSLPTGGIRRLSDCGMITCRIVCKYEKPSERAASVWLLSMLIMAALIISAQYAAQLNEKAVKAARSEEDRAAGNSEESQPEKNDPEATAPPFKAADN